jgi:hypothetical protein
MFGTSEVELVVICFKPVRLGEKVADYSRAGDMRLIRCRSTMLLSTFFFSLITLH